MSELGNLLFHVESLSSEFGTNDALTGMVMNRDGSLVVAGFTNG
jgi:hypothetical protein